MVSRRLLRIGEVTGDPMPFSDFPELRLDCFTAIFGDRTTGMKPAPAWNIYRTRHFPFQNGSVASRRWIGDWNRLQKYLCIRMQGPAKKFTGVRKLHNPTQIHHRDTIRKVMNNA